MEKRSVFWTLIPITQAAAITTVIMYPVDILRALKMASATGEKQTMISILRSFIQVHGVKGIFKQGLFPELARATWMRISKFFFFPIFHQKLWGKPELQGTPFSRAIAGAFAAFPEVMVITPIELSKIALQIDQKKQFSNSSIQAIKYVYKNKGPLGLFVGYAGIQYRQASWTAVYFATLNYTENYISNIILRQTENATLTNTQKRNSQLIAGFVAGVLGGVANTPGDVVRTAMQKRALHYNHDLVRPQLSLSYVLSGISDFFITGKQIVKERGVGALYYGFGFKAFHLGGCGALLAFLMPYCKSMWDKKLV